MIRKKILSLLILAFLGNVLSLHSEMAPIQAEKHHLIYKILENQGYCVSVFDEDRIFIHPENIISTNEGLVIDLNGSEFYPLPLLQFNRNGHFIERSFMQDIDLVTTNSRETKGPCPNCDVNTSKYGHCKNPNCEFYGLRVL